MGGAIMLGVGVLVVVALVVLLLNVIGGGSSKHPSTTPTASAGAGAPTSSSSTTSTSGTGTPSSGTGTSTSGTTPQAQVVGQSNLNPPGGNGTAKAVAFVVKEGSAFGIVIEASNVAPNSHNAYAAWLYNSPTDAYRLGFVNPPVGKNGKLEVGSPLPTNASHYKQLLLTLETQSNPKSPGTIVLQGPFSITTSTK